jgi:hypothetical protein
MTEDDADVADSVPFSLFAVAMGRQHTPLPCAGLAATIPRRQEAP